MISTIQAQDISLEELQENFGLQLATDGQFFREWQDNLPSLTDEEKSCLARVRSNFFNLVNRRPLLEEGVKLARSYALSIDRENELEQVLAALKSIGQLS